MRIIIKPTRLSFGIIIFILALSFNKGVAQNSIAKTLAKAQIKFNVTGFLSDKLDLDNSGTSLLSSSAGLGGEATVLYSHHIFYNFRLNAGIGWSVYSYNYSYHFLVPPGSIFDTGSNTIPVFTTRGYDPHVEKTIYTVPLSVQKTFPIKIDYTIEGSLEAGIKINIKESFPYGSQSRSTVQINDQTEADFFRYDFESNEKKTFVSYLLKAGLIKRNSGGNLFYFNVMYHFSPAIIGIGEY